MRPKRKMERRGVPVGVRCRLCRLDPEGDYEAWRLDVGFADRGPIAALNKYRWLCDACVGAIVKGAAP